MNAHKVRSVAIVLTIALFTASCGITDMVGGWF
jgi:hypothetical protein